MVNNIDELESQHAESYQFPCELAMPRDDSSLVYVCRFHVV